MKFKLHAVLGNLMAGSGLAIFAWALFIAERVGHGFGAGVNAFGMSFPVAMPILAAFGLFVFGGAIAANKDSH